MSVVDQEQYDSTNAKINNDWAKINKGDANQGSTNAALVDAAKLLQVSHSLKQLQKHLTLEHEVEAPNAEQRKVEALGSNKSLDQANPNVPAKVSGTEGSDNTSATTNGSDVKGSTSTKVTTQTDVAKLAGKDTGGTLYYHDMAGAGPFPNINDNIPPINPGHGLPKEPVDPKTGKPDRGSSKWWKWYQTVLQAFMQNPNWDIKGLGNGVQSYMTLLQLGFEYSNNLDNVFKNNPGLAAKYKELLGDALKGFEKGPDYPSMSPKDPSNPDPTPSPWANKFDPAYDNFKKFMNDILQKEYISDYNQYIAQGMTPTAAKAAAEKAAMGQINNMLKGMKACIGIQTPDMQKDLAGLLKDLNDMIGDGSTNTTFFDNFRVTDVNALGTGPDELPTQNKGDPAQKYLDRFNNELGSWMTGTSSGKFGENIAHAMADVFWLYNCNDNIFVLLCKIMMQYQSKNQLGQEAVYALQEKLLSQASGDIGAIQNDLNQIMEDPTNQGAARDLKKRMEDLKDLMNRAGPAFGGPTGTAGSVNNTLQKMLDGIDNCDTAGDKSGNNIKHFLDELATDPAAATAGINAILTDNSGSQPSPSYSGMMTGNTNAMTTVNSTNSSTSLSISDFNKQVESFESMVTKAVSTYWSALIQAFAQMSG